MSDWQELAKTALEEEEKPIKAKSATINVVATGIAAVFAVLGPAAVAVFEPLEGKPAAEMIGAAGVIAAALIAIAVIAASDYRTRGALGGARLAALAKLAGAAAVEPSNGSAAPTPKVGPNDPDKGGLEGVVATTAMRARASGHTYRVLAVGWSGKPDDADYWYLLWNTGEKAGWFSAHDVDRVEHANDA